MDAAATRHAETVRRAVEDSQTLARSAIAASWRRSAVAHGLDPATPAEAVLDASRLREAREAVEPLLRVSRPVLERLFQTVGAAGCCVVLTSRSGVILERRGEAADDASFQRAGLWDGAIWSEAVQGTNGIGTCLAEGRTVTVSRDQHFRAANINLSCATAPVFDEFGQLAAALDVSSRRDDLGSGVLNLLAGAAAEAARAIEADNFRNAFHACRIVMAPGPPGSAAGLLAVDPDDLVVGATRQARQNLGLSDLALAARPPAADLFGREAGGDAWREAERAVVVRALARCGGKVSAAARDLGVSRATLHRKLKRLGLHGAD